MVLESHFQLKLLLLDTALFAALADCVRIEYIPDYDGLVQVWCSLHGEVSDKAWTAALRSR